jgi:glycosyltransferase involved in cell wall biosynthesis
MKIALVAQNATPLHPRAGSGPDHDDIGLSDLTCKLAGQGHQVTVYAQKNLADQPDQAQLHAGVRVEHIDVGPLSPATETAACPDGLDDAGLLERVPAFSGPLRSIWQSERPDVVHALRWTSGLAALAAARDLAIPVVQEFTSLSVTERRDAGLPELRGGRARSALRGLRDEPGAVKADGASAARIRLEPAIGRSASAVVATNSAEVSDLARLGVHRSAIRVVPWGVDTGLFAPEGPAAKRHGRPRLLTASDLTQRQPLETLMRALTRIPGAELLVVGGPAEADLHGNDNYVKLAKFAATLGIADRVIFTGQVSYAAMPPLLRSADLVISTCQYEPSGTTSLQAMACGTPVIAPPVGGHMDAVVDGTTGIIQPPDRPALLAQRIRQLLAHPMLVEAYGVAAVDRVRSRYSWDRIADETLAVYSRVAAPAA